MRSAVAAMEAAPALGNAVADAIDLRDEAQAVARRVDHAILRCKLKAVRTARGLYRVAKGYVTLDAGDPVRTHLAEMKRARAAGKPSTRS